MGLTTLHRGERRSAGALHAASRPPGAARLLPAALLLLLAPHAARAQAAAPPATTALARIVTAALRSSPAVAQLNALGYNFSAIPPDFSANLNFAPTPIPSSSGYVNQARAMQREQLRQMRIAVTADASFAAVLRTGA